MRDKRFISEHRGGPLKKTQHFHLMKWSCDVAEHVLPLFGEIDERLTNALNIAKAWMQEKVSVGEARKASLEALAVARESSNPTAIAVAHSVSQVVATAHMADHSLVSAWYALRAVKKAGKSEQIERKWQDEKIPPEIKELVLSARAKRNI